MTARPRTPADARRRAGTPPEGRVVRAKGLDLYHLLSAVVGAMAGLVAYSAVVHLPDGGAEAPVREGRMDVAMREMKGRLDAEGYFRVSGRLANLRQTPCRRVAVSVRFLKGDAEVAKGFAMVTEVPAAGAKPFEVKGFAPGATAFDATVDLADF